MGHEHRHGSPSRRDFLGATAAAGACLQLSPLAFSAVPELAQAMGHAAQAWLGSLAPQDVARARLAWADAGRNAWHYVPRSRPGVALREMTAAQAAAAWDLFATLLSARGLEQARGQLLLERTLGELTRNERFRDPGNYALVLFGDPADRAPWCWRFEGHADRLQAGPDFTQYRGGSGYDEPPLHELDAGDKRQVLAAFDAAREWLWRNARKARGQGISLRYREVLRFLLNMAGRFGTVFPSPATIAAACACSVKTVCNALAWLKTWGFLTWRRRLKRVQTSLGMMVRQTSNAYRIALSGLASIGAAVLNRGSGRNNSAPSRSMTSPLQL